MNEVDYLLENNFTSLAWDRKLEVKQLGPHRPENFDLINFQNEQHKHKKKLTFQCEWFDRKTWLTASVSRNSLFCFPCLLYGGDTVWAKSGFKDLKHLSERLTKHENSSSHLQNAVRLRLLGRADEGGPDGAGRGEIRQHNRQVDGNRHVLAKVIAVLKLCGNSNEPGMFRSVFEALCEDDVTLRSHYDDSPAFKGKSDVIQKELLGCMYSIYREHVANEVARVRFISVQVDEMVDASGRSHVSTIFRYMLREDTVVERFIGFSEVRDRTAVVESVLECCEVEKDKLIAVTYDGAVEAGGVRALVGRGYPHAHFVHCCSHALGDIVRQVCSVTHAELKVFFAHLSGFPAFFSASPRRAAAFEDAVRRKVPGRNGTRWDFKDDDVKAVHGNLEELRECMREFQEWDAATIRESYGLLNLLNDARFLCLLSFFALVMPEVEVLYGRLHKRNIDCTILSTALHYFKEAVGNVRDRADELSASHDDDKTSVLSKRRRTTEGDLGRVMREACDAVVRHLEDRFSEAGHLIAAQLVDVDLFQGYAEHFPDCELEAATKLYPMLNRYKLRTELRVLYGHSELLADVSSAVSLLRSLAENDVKELFGETAKLLEIVLTTPMMTADPGRCFPTLERVRSCLGSPASRETLNALAVLTVEHRLVKSIPDFNARVMERFARLKDRREQFLHKTQADARNTAGELQEAEAVWIPEVHYGTEDEVDTAPETFVLPDAPKLRCPYDE